MNRIKSSFVCITVAIVVAQLSYAPVAAAQAADCPPGDTFVPQSALIQAGVAGAEYPGACIPAPNAVVVTGCPGWLRGWGFAAGVALGVASFVALSVATGGTAWGVAMAIANIAGGQAFVIGLGCRFGATFQGSGQVNHV